MNIIKRQTFFTLHILIPSFFSLCPNFQDNTKIFRPLSNGSLSFLFHQDIQ